MAAPCVRSKRAPMRTNTTVETTLSQAMSTDGSPTPLLVHRPAIPQGWLVWAHGGSWQYGSAYQWAPVTSELATRSGWAVVSVDYRLAPDHQFPAAIHDMNAALDWTEKHAQELPVLIGGDSAGGTIAAVTALVRLNNEGQVPAQVLAYPPLDPDCTGASYASGPRAFPNPADLRAAWQSWLGPDPEPSSLHATPLHAKSLAGLAPVSLIVGDCDPVRDDAAAYADQLTNEGVTARLHVLPGVGHADLLNPSGLVLPAIAAVLNNQPITDAPQFEATATDPRAQDLKGTPS